MFHSKSCRKYQNTFCIQQFFFIFRKSCRLWDNVWKIFVKWERQHMTKRRMRFAPWITNVPQRALIIRNALQRQQWLRQSFSVLRYTYLARLFFNPKSVVHLCVCVYPDKPLCREPSVQYCPVCWWQAVLPSIWVHWLTFFPCWTSPIRQNWLIYKISEYSCCKGIVCVTVRAHNGIVRWSYPKSWATFFFGMLTGNNRRRRVRW